MVEDSAGAAARLAARLDHLLARLKTSARGTRRGDEPGAIHDTRVAVRRIPMSGGSHRRPSSIACGSNARSARNASSWSGLVSSPNMRLLDDR